MICSLVLAVGKEDQSTHLAPIGIDGDLPWPFLKSDMAWFVEKTKNRPVIMGHSTWVSIPLPRRPLKGRFNIIVTSDPQEREKQYLAQVEASILPNNLKFVDSPKKAYDAAFEHLQNTQASQPIQECTMIGGNQLIESFLQLDLIDTIYLTKVDRQFPGCDTFFDVSSLSRWPIEAKVKEETEEIDGIATTLGFYTYSR